MTSLADELNFGEGSDDVNLGSSGQGLQMSSEDELQGGSSNPNDSPPSSLQPRRRGRGGGRRKRAGYDSSDDEPTHQRPSSLILNGEPFSLADELGEGEEQMSEQHDENNRTSKQHRPTSSSGDLPPLIDTIILDPDMKARRDQEHYLTSSEILNESFRSTKRFLQDLTHASSGITTGASASYTLPPSSSYSSVNEIRIAPEDGLSTLEGRAGSLLKQMREQMSTREEQIRELQECDRVLKRAIEEGGDWIVALADADQSRNDFSSDIEEGHPNRDLSFISTPSRYYKRGGLREASTVEGEIGGAEGALDTSHSPNPTSLQDSNGSLTLCQHLALLQTSTVDLVVSLGSIHEQSQVAQASMNDAARRIRSIKTVLNTWTADVRSAEDSQAHITAWESESNQTPRDTQEWTRDQIDKFQWILNDADTKARELLRPIQDPILDQLAAIG